MTEIKVLTLLELRSLYGFNKFLHSKDPKAKNRYKLLGIVWTALILMVFGYVGGLVYGYCSLGLSDIVPGYLVMIASLLILAFGLFKAGNGIFGGRSYDILSAMPLKANSIVVSRFLLMYVEDLLLSAAIMIPGMVVYGICEKPGIGFYLTGFVGTFLIPVIPLVFATLLGTLIMAVSSRLKQKSLVQTLLMLGVVVAILVGSFGMASAAEEITLEMLANLSQMAADAIGRLYPPALWLGNAMLRNSVSGLLNFLLVSLGMAALTVWTISRYFHSIMRKLLTFSAKHTYQIGNMESRSLLKALYFRELKRYFSSSIYVTNTIIGPIMGCIMAGAVCFVGLDKLLESIPYSIDIRGLVPFAMAAVFCMMTTTSTAISMEGKQVWVVQSMPIPLKTLFDSKILLNLSLMLPFYLLSEVFLVIALRPGLMELVWLLALPALLMIFSAVIGITVNLKFHSFDWEKEEMVVKQSASAMLGGFAGMLLAVLLGVGVFLTPVQFSDLVKLVICMLLVGGTWFLYQKNNSTTILT